MNFHSMKRVSWEIFIKFMMFCAVVILIKRSLTDDAQCHANANRRSCAHLTSTEAKQGLELGKLSNITINSLVDARVTLLRIEDLSCGNESGNAFIKNDFSVEKIYNYKIPTRSKLN